MNFIQRPVFTTSLLIATLTCVQANATSLEQETKRNEFYGVSSGFVVGAILGGPIGAIVASFTGATIADNINNKKRSKNLREQLSEQQYAYEKLQDEYHVLLAASNVKPVEQHASVKQLIPVESQIQFTTASADLQSHYKTSLMALARALASEKHMHVQLFGYADRRGDTAYNQLLSENRVQAVREFLINHGVNEEQIDTTSYGEEQPVLAEQNHENDFFDRRVVMRVQAMKKVMTAFQ